MARAGQASNNFYESLIGKSIFIYMIGEVRITNVEFLDGILIGFDEYTLIINRDGENYLIYKHAIESICEA